MNNALSSQNTKIDEFTEAIINNVNSLKDSRIKKIVNLFIIPFLIGLMFMLITPFCNLSINKYISKNKKFFEKIITNELISSIDNSQHLKYLKIITADNLEVKSEASRKSKCIANLKFGEIVLVISKNRTWSFIQKNNDEGEVIFRGWVFSRYLKKIE